MGRNTTGQYSSAFAGVVADFALDLNYPKDRALLNQRVADLEADAKELRSIIDKLYYAPGMPGYEEALKNSGHLFGKSLLPRLSLQPRLDLSHRIHLDQLHPQAQMSSAQVFNLLLHRGPVGVVQRLVMLFCPGLPYTIAVVQVAIEPHDLRVKVPKRVSGDPYIGNVGRRRAVGKTSAFDLWLHYIFFLLPVKKEKTSLFPSLQFALKRLQQSHAFPPCLRVVFVVLDQCFALRFEPTPKRVGLCRTTCLHRDGKRL